MSDSKTVIALFNYGGGMRGLVPAHIMTKIEESTDLRMAEMVDIFAGPSTGAILNAALNVPHPDDPTKPKYRARHMVKFYERDGIKIFPRDRFRDFRGMIHDFNNRTMKIGQLNKLFRHGHYNPKYLARSLNALYGDTLLSDSLSSLIVPVYNLDGEQLKPAIDKGEGENTPVHTLNNFVDEGGHAVWFKNMKLAGSYNPAPRVKMFDAIMASTAAPTYFPCHHFEAVHSDRRGKLEYSGIDGSLFDNPCISYHGAIRQHLEPGTRLIMIVLGTGYTMRSIKKDEWNSFGGLGVVDPVHDLPLIRILFHAPESALVESFSQEMGNNAFIFNKSIASADKAIRPTAEIDDASPENLRQLQHFAEAIVEENKSKFDQICDLLVQNRDQKQNQPQDTQKGWFSAFKNKLKRA
jgi:predicted acylesterase/phospholipase RssA